MVYIYSYQVGHECFFSLCPTIQHALSLASTHAGDYGYTVRILPYNCVPRTFNEFRQKICGVRSPESCDISKHDIIVFEFQYNVSLLIKDLYE